MASKKNYTFIRTDGRTDQGLGDVAGQARPDAAVRQPLDEHVDVR